METLNKGIVNGVFLNKLKQNSAMYLGDEATEIIAHGYGAPRKLPGHIFASSCLWNCHPACAEQ
jgi:hypothetical protein